MILPFALTPLETLGLFGFAGSFTVAAWFHGQARRARRALQVSEARQRSILDGSGEAVIIIDEQARIAALNPAAERMFGYSAAELLGASLETLMTSRARQAHADHLRRHGATAMVEAVRLRALHRGVRKHGDVFRFELIMTEWRDGARRMFTGAMRDVSERERAEAALRESQARYAGLYENSAELLFVYQVAGNGDFVLESMNRTAETYTGHPRSVVVGRTPDDFAGPREARALKRALLQCLELGGTVPHAFHLRVGGERRRLQVSLSPLRDGAGEITRILAQARDDRAGPGRDDDVHAPATAAA